MRHSREKGFSSTLAGLLLHVLAAVAIVTGARAHAAAGAFAEKRWSATDEDGAAFVMVCDESSAIGTLAYKTAVALLPDQPLSKWTFMWLLINNENGADEVNYHPGFNTIHITWQDSDGSLRQASSEDIHLGLALSAIEIGVNHRPGIEQVLDLFDSVEVMPGVSEMRVVIFKTSRSLKESEIKDVYITLSPLKGKVKMTAMSKGTPGTTEGEKAAEPEAPRAGSQAQTVSKLWKGFESIPWGASVRDVPGLTVAYSSQAEEHYIRPGDPLSIGKSTFTERYVFRGDRLCSLVVIGTSVKDDGAAQVQFETLRAETCARLQAGMAEADSGDEIVATWKPSAVKSGASNQETILTATLRYNRKSRLVTLTVTSSGTVQTRK